MPGRGMAVHPATGGGVRPVLTFGCNGGGNNGGGNAGGNVNMDNIMAERAEEERAWLSVGK